MKSHESREAAGISKFETVKESGPSENAKAAVGVGDNVVVVAGIGIAGDG